LKFDCCTLNSYVRELDGEEPELYVKWLEYVAVEEVAA